MGAAVVGDLPLPGGFTCGVRLRVRQLRAVQFVLLDIDDDLVPVFDESDRSADRGLRSDMSDDEANRAARETRVRHERDHDVLVAAQGGDSGGWVQHLRHTRGAARTFVPHDDDVVVGKVVGALFQGVEQFLFGVEDARRAGEDVRPVRDVIP